MTQVSSRIVSIRALLEAGAHFGHQTKRWNPKMEPYIFAARNGIHIIDLKKTVNSLTRAHDFILNTVANGGSVLFVGTKKQAQEVIQEEATRAGQPYITQRWLGGTLTNFVTIRKRLRYLADLEEQRDRGDFARLTKAEGMKREKEITKLNRTFGGIKTMDRLPKALFLVDPREEEIALREARKVDIPVVAMVDTDCNPSLIDYVIPCNDDAIRSIRLITSTIADSVIEGQHHRHAQHYDSSDDGSLLPGVGFST